MGKKKKKEKEEKKKKRTRGEERAGKRGERWNEFVF